MNQVTLHTNKGEYLPGDVVFGAVYLNIVSPTAAQGAKLNFKGVEYFVYEDVQIGDGRKIPVHREEKRDVIDCTNVSLYHQDVPFSLGSYVFPFRMTLLHNIPGSFNDSGVHDIQWKAAVKYWIQVVVEGVENLQATQDFTVKQVPLGNELIADPPPSVESRQEVTRFKLFRKKYAVSAGLHSSLHQTGDCIMLRITPTVPNGSNVKCIRVKLQQSITFTTRAPSDGVGAGSKLVLYPERGVCTIWESAIKDVSSAILNGGLDSIRIPLKKINGRDLNPSVSGSLVQCLYSVDVDVAFDDGIALHATVPIPCVSPKKNLEWSHWTPPSWVSDAKRMLSDSDFSVSTRMLKSESFSGLPGFQAL